jgi:hypothetical protein
MQEANISASKLADARKAVEAIKGLNRDIESVAAASADVCLLKGRRFPFIALVNPQYKDEELRAAYLVAGLQAQPQFISTGPSTQSADGKYITKVGPEIIHSGDVGKAYETAMKLTHEKQGVPSVTLEFTDKSNVTLKPYDGCAGIVYVDVGTYEVANFGLGLEILSTSWFDSTHNRDERLFLAGRSLYFASDAGAARINKGLLGGAALNGILTGLTMGISRRFVDTKFMVTRMMRSGVFKEADDFGLRAAVRAGADPKMVLAYVQRMAKEKENATDFKELWFEDGRVEALAATVVNVLGTLNHQEQKSANLNIKSENEAF